MRRYLFCFLSISFSCFAQEPKLDSLRRVLYKAKTDTSRISILGVMGEHAFSISPDSALLYFNQVIQLSEKNLENKNLSQSLIKLFKGQLGSALSNLGVIHKQEGNINLALELYEESLIYHKEVGNADEAASTLSNIGGVYFGMGNVQLALKKYKEAAKMLIGNDDKRPLGAVYNNIGIIYQNQADIENAVEYFQRSRKIFEEVNEISASVIVLGNIGFIFKNNNQLAKAKEIFNQTLSLSEKHGYKRGVAEALNNIGLIHSDAHEYSTAEEYFKKSLKIREELHDKKGIAACYNNFGILFKIKGDDKSALEYYTKAYQIRMDLGDKQGIATSLVTLGSFYNGKKKYNEAIKYSLLSLENAQQLGFPEYIYDAARLLFKIYKATSNFEQAYKYYEISINMKDSMISERNRKASIKSELKYEYEKRAAADSVKNAEEQKVKDAQLEAQNASFKSEKTQRYALYGGLILVITFLVFVFKRFRITQRQKKIIEAQKQMVDTAFEKLHEKNKEVLDSIHYAKRIQTALLTSHKYIDRKLNELKKEG